MPETKESRKIYIGRGGFVQLIRVFGDDLTAVQAARVSFDGDAYGDDRDWKLLRYLKANRHDSPFEMSDLVFKLRLPLDLMQQLLRHRTAKVNQVSGRYTVLAIGTEYPTAGEWRRQSKTAKQCSDGFLPDSVGEDLTARYLELVREINAFYAEMIDAGVAKEQARRILPTGTLTECILKFDLRNLLHFLELRTDKHAQYEMQQYATAILDLAEERFPKTFEIWRDLKNG